MPTAALARVLCDPPPPSFPLSPPGTPLAAMATRERHWRRRLAGRNIKLAYKQAQRVMRPGLDPDAILSAAMHGLLMAAKNYQPSRGWRFSTYCTWAVRRALWRAPRPGSVVYVPPHPPEKYARCAERARATVYIDDLAGFRPTTFDGPPAESDQALPAALSRLARAWPLGSACVEMSFQDGLNNAEIGARIGVSKERVRQHIRRAVALLRGWIEAEGPSALEKAAGRAS